MSLPELASLVEKALLYWLVAMAAVVVWRCVSGRINLAGMLTHSDADPRPTPERVQLLVGFLFATVAYAQLALAATQAPGSPTPTALPDVPNELLVLFAGSHSIYLAGKFGRMRSAGRGLSS
ncbi:MAG TPA: hypothetical protein VG889_17855 [Rhizomicrobium sp.]|nr:hypothetical protein [Rhizomicrobium sp.]